LGPFAQVIPRNCNRRTHAQTVHFALHD
jgi:hypothetical protein